MRPFNQYLNVVNVLHTLVSSRCRLGVVFALLNILSLYFLPSPKEATYYFVYHSFDNSRFAFSGIGAFILIYLIMLFLPFVCM